MRDARIPSCSPKGFEWMAGGMTVGQIGRLALGSAAFVAAGFAIVYASAWVFGRMSGWW